MSTRWLSFGTLALVACASGIDPAPAQVAVHIEPSPMNRSSEHAPPIDGVTLPTSRTAPRVRLRPNVIITTDGLFMPEQSDFRLGLVPHQFHGQVFEGIEPPDHYFGLPPVAERLPAAPEAGYFVAIDASLDWSLLYAVMSTAQSVSPRPWLLLAVQDAEGRLGALPFSAPSFPERPKPPTRSIDRPVQLVLTTSIELSVPVAAAECPTARVAVTLDELGRCAATLRRDAGDLRTVIIPTGEGEQSIARLVAVVDALRGRADGPNLSEVVLVLR